MRVLTSWKQQKANWQYSTQYQPDCKRGGWVRAKIICATLHQIICNISINHESKLHIFCRCCNAICSPVSSRGGDALQSPTVSLSLSLRHVILCEMTPIWNSHHLQQEAHGASECQIERYFEWVQKSQGDTDDYYRSTRLKSVLSVPVLLLCLF